MNLPEMVKYQLDRRIPMSQKEDQLIAQVKYSEVFSQSNESVFKNLLKNNPDTFYHKRIDKDLFRQWHRFLSCKIIPDDPNSISDNMNKQSCELNTQGDPNSFSDTELILEETVASALQCGLINLKEPSATSRRQHLLTQKNYHSFQGIINQSVLDELISCQNKSEQITNQTIPNEFNRSECYSEPLSPSIARIKKNLTRDFPSPSLLNSGKASSSLVSTLSDEAKLQTTLELHRNRRRTYAKLRKVHEEAIRWTKLVEMRVTNGLEISDPIPHQTLAMLSGQRSRYLIKEEEATFGRESSIYRPDIDLSIEGDVSHISRCHGKICLAPNGIFWITNFSTHPIFVNGVVLLKDEEVELCDMAIISISRISLRFDINKLYVNLLCTNQ